jgi:PEP-CTERM motif
MARTAVSRRIAWVLVALLWLLAGRAEGLSLGSFDFDPAHFGDTVILTPGNSTLLAPDRNWLNVVNANPGVTGALTGPSFDTGMLSAGFAEGNPEFFSVRTIGYSTPIMNQPGLDVGIILGGLGAEAPSRVAVSVSADGASFFEGAGTPAGAWGSSALAGDAFVIAPAPVDTGVTRTYFHGDFCQCGFTDPVTLRLWVEPIDLSAFGIADGDGVSAVRILGDPDLALIRIAGLEPAAVPEPSTLLLLGTGLLAVAWMAGRRRNQFSWPPSKNFAPGRLGGGALPGRRPRQHSGHNVTGAPEN